MFPAAREGDPANHASNVSSGVIGPPESGPCPMPPVIIEMLPAAHLTCTVRCSGMTAIGPAHPPRIKEPALIVKGSLTVLIHGMSAARWAPAADVTDCGAILGDPQAAASRTVLIGG